MSIKVPPFPGVSHQISLVQAITMTQKYRLGNETILEPVMRNMQILPFSETFNREDFDKLLSQADCEGIRLYYGMDEELKVHIIAVGVNSRNEDIAVDSGSVLIENSFRCPVTCPPASVLNS